MPRVAPDWASAHLLCLVSTCLPVCQPGSLALAKDGWTDRQTDRQMEADAPLLSPEQSRWSQASPTVRVTPLVLGLCRA